MSAIRRRSSQYSLFPNCSPTPEKDSAPNANIGHLRKRHSEGSVRSLAAHIPPASANDFPTDNNIVLANNRQPKQSSNMARLIPLKLEATTSDTKTSSPSDKPLPLLPPIELAQRPPTPIESKPFKKARPGPVTDLTILPYTQKEWSTVMEEVRVLYSKGQYKHCATRCKQILEGIKDPYRVHPLYSIYMSFFAASSLEMTASTLNNHSSTKLPLFQESLSYYQKASQFVEYASFSADPSIAYASHQITTYGHASHSSIASSIRSSVDSVFSQTSASSFYSASPSLPDSPTFEEESLKRSASNSSSSGSEGSRRTSGRFQNRKKKVSFSLHLPTLNSQTSLALSPGTGGAVDDSILAAFPAPPSVQEKEPSIASPRSSISTPTTQSVLSSYVLNQSVIRYRSHLISLKSQLNYHISSIHSQIGSLSEVRKTRRSNLPNEFTERKEQRDGEEPSKEKMELRERIERLKSEGWKRKRFDGERYRALCERALCEVDERV